MRSSIAAGATIALAMVLIASTWTIFSATTDEPIHLSAGLELLANHQYTLQPWNPPLPRVVFAFVPWRLGLQYDPRLNLIDQLKVVFHHGGRYTRNLAIARAGNLLFFLIAAIATWLWARREMGNLGGFIATLLFALQPTILGHSGVVTHDAPGTAGVAVAILAFTRWLEHPTIGRAAAFGAAYGFSIACKFSSIPYVPAACLAIYLVRIMRDAEARRAWRKALIAFPVASIVCLLVIWASYAGSLRAFIDGIQGLMAVNSEGHLAYLFGKVSMSGWWWYFPVALALKTTIAVLLLVVLGFVFARRERVFAESLAAAMAILLVSMTARLDLGLRYVLPVYVPLAVAAAAVALAMIRSPRTIVRASAIALLAAHAGAALLAHPDHLAYFNAFAGRDPSRYLVDSNLDWGQDVLRLAKIAREEKIDRIGVSVSGNHDFTALGFPPHYAMQPWGAAHGWVAVGDHSYRTMRADGGWRWLVGKKYRRAGKSIRLYYIP